MLLTQWSVVLECRLVKFKFQKSNRRPDTSRQLDLSVCGYEISIYIRTYYIIYEIVGGKWPEAEMKRVK